MSGKYTLHFHGGCKPMHRGGGALMILEHLKLLGKLDYDVKGGPYDPDSGFGETQTKMARFAPLLTMPNGKVMSQSVAIAFHLGKTFGICPADEATAIMITANWADLYGESGPYRAEPIPAERCQMWLDTFEAALEESGTGFLVGPELSYVDLQCFSIVACNAKIGNFKGPPPGEPLGGVKPGPKLADWIEMMKGTEAWKSLAAKGHTCRGYEL
jgi:glutathione S-transferase